MLASILLLCLVAIHCSAQQEKLFSELNAYNPVPSPDGKSVALVEIGRRPGEAGFGRSNLMTTVRFANGEGKLLGDGRVEAFLGEWLPDSSAVACYRDGRFGLVTAAGWQTSHQMPPDGPHTIGTYARAERVAYLSSRKTFVWLQTTPSKTLLQTPDGPIGQLGVELPPSDLVVPSPDGRYLAIAGTAAGNGFHLWVYDLEKKTSSDIGEVTVHPNTDWDYIKPSWNPWFRDSSRLAYLSGGVLYVVTPDGQHRRKVAELENAGLPVPSPDGTRIAYVIFAPRPMKLRPDMRFWGGATVWVMDAAGGKPAAVTRATPDTIYDLRWLDDSTLLFDRISDEMFYKHARIWTVTLK